MCVPWDPEQQEEEGVTQGFGGRDHLQMGTDGFPSSNKQPVHTSVDSSAKDESRADTKHKDSSGLDLNV